MECKPLTTVLVDLTIHTVTCGMVSGRWTETWRWREGEREGVGEGGERERK